MQQATSVPGQRTAPRPVQREVKPRTLLPILVSKVIEIDYGPATRGESLGQWKIDGEHEWRFSPADVDDCIREAKFDEQVVVGGHRARHDNFSRSME